MCSDICGQTVRHPNPVGTNVPLYLLEKCIKINRAKWNNTHVLFTSSIINVGIIQCDVSAMIEIVEIINNNLMWELWNKISGRDDI